MTTYLVNWAAQNGPNGRLLQAHDLSINDVENQLMHQIDHQIMQHIIEVIHTLQMFAGIYRDFAGKSECGDFKFMGIACYVLAIPVIWKSPRSDFHCNI